MIRLCAGLKEKRLLNTSFNRSSNDREIFFNTGAFSNGKMQIKPKNDLKKSVPGGFLVIRVTPH
jgi:hypothetical protein